MLLKVFALIVTLDGALTAVWGRGYLRWLEDHLPWPVPQFARWLMTWPEPLLRGGGALQALMGWGTFWRLSGPHWPDEVRWHDPSSMRQQHTEWH